METITMSQNDELIMKLLHYFVTEQNYSPIILKGVQNEIWLENLNSDYKIIRLVSNYIHNNEQMEMDLFRTEQIMQKIKKKTMSFSINSLSIFVNLGENVTIENDIANMSLVNIKKISDLKKYEFVLDEFPTITKDTDFKEKGLELFMKLTKEIGQKNEEEAKKAEDIFTKKNPIITKVILLINLLVYILSFVYGQNFIVGMFGNYAPSILNGEYYRLITSAFVHVSLVHLLCNMYALYIIGTQIENFFGKFRFSIIYLVSAITGSMLSIIFNTSSYSIGASGAIFGLLGALLYFGYHYRVYLDSVIKSQIIPIIILNLSIGFMIPGIDNACHIGGLVGGVLTSMAVGVKYKSENKDYINGIIMSLIFIGFLIYMIFFH